MGLPLQVQNMRNPSGLAGLSSASVLLATGGNGLMVPRALLLRDPVWLAGSAWGCFMGWAQLLTLFLGRTGAGCAWPCGCIQVGTEHRSRSLAGRQRLGLLHGLGPAAHPSGPHSC